MTDHVHEEHADVEYCPKHPRSEARLRCNRCGRLMCTRCAVHTPTGYRCDDCVRGQQKVFITAKPQDYILGPLAAAILSLVAGMIVSRLWIYFIILAAPFAGGAIAEVVRRVVGRRRDRRLFQAAAAAVVIGGLLPGLVPFGVSYAASGWAGMLQILGVFGFDLLWRLVYAVLAGGAAYYRLSGLRL